MTIPELLKQAKTIAVVGLSSKPDRSSFGVSAYMQQQGYKIIPVTPVETEVLGEKAYPRLEDVPVEIDIVNVFRRSEYVPDIVDSAIAVGAKAIWTQLGVVHEDAAGTAAEAGLTVVMDRCIAVEHRLRVG